MSSQQTSMARKRDANETLSDDDQANKPKKQKMAASHSEVIPLPSATVPRLLQRMIEPSREDIRQILAEAANSIHSSLPSEKDEISSDLDSGSYKLILEHNKSHSAICRASKCLVQELSRQYDAKIHSPNRINLEATQPSNAHWTLIEKPERRFHHVSCFEAIGIDTANSLRLPQERTWSPGVRRGSIVSIERFHPAVVDWVAYKGKAYDSDMYGGEYGKESGMFEDKEEQLHQNHIFGGEECTCGLRLARPKSTGFIQGEPS